MFIIECPWCGKRDQSEFTAHGEAHIARPPDPSSCDDKEWGDYLFFRQNPKGREKAAVTPVRYLSGIHLRHL